MCLPVRDTVINEFREHLAEFVSKIVRDRVNSRNSSGIHC